MVFVNIVHQNTAHCWKKRQSENSHISVTNSDTAKIPTDLNSRPERKFEKYYFFTGVNTEPGENVVYSVAGLQP